MSERVWTGQRWIYPGSDEHRLAQALQKASDTLHSIYVNEGVRRALDACQEAEALIRDLGFPPPDPPF